MRERPRDKARLEHILTACEIIADALREDGFEAIMAKPLMKYGLVKQVEIIGEAVYMLTKEFKEQHPVAEWDAIEGMRHVLVHDYYRVSVKTLHNVVEKDVPTLRQIVQELYDKQTESEREAH